MRKRSVAKKVGDKFTLNCGVTVTIVEKLANGKSVVRDAEGNQKEVHTGALGTGEVAWLFDNEGNPLVYSGLVEVGQKYVLNCGVEVTVIGLNPILITDNKGNSRTCHSGPLRAGKVSWVGVPSHKTGTKTTKVGDRVTLACGVDVEVVEYRNTDCVVIRDDQGNEKITSASQLRKGSVSWKQFGVRTKTKLDQRFKIGYRKLSKRNGYYEVVELISRDKIKIVWDDHEISQYCTADQLDNNTVKPKSESYASYLDTLKKFYVYLVIDISENVVYVGKGKLRRLLHANSGTSRNYHLNRLHFLGRIARVEVHTDDLTEEDSLNLERELILQHNPICNTSLNPRQDCNIT